LYLNDFPTEEARKVRYSVKMLEFPHVVKRESEYWASGTIPKPGIETFERLYRELVKNRGAVECAMHFAKLRRMRDKALRDSDKTQLADYPCSQKERVHWREYREYLRRLPTQYNDESVARAKVMTFDEWKDFFLKN
jgi:hypothetical protein